VPWQPVLIEATPASALPPPRDRDAMDLPNQVAIHLKNAGLRPAHDSRKISGKDREPFTPR
jgi:hypothetical protein